MIQRFPFRVFATALIAAGVTPMALKWWLCPVAGCAEKRALERHIPYQRTLRIIGCNLLEICVI
jgi:hypothetical protein